MPPKNIAALKTQLFGELNGSKLSRIKDELIKKCAEDDRKEVVAILMQYVKEGKILHWRDFLLTDIIKNVLDGEQEYAGFFEWTITIDSLAYWGIDGLLKTVGKDSYGELVEMIKNERLPLSVRAKAVKSIAEFSKQPFDKDLPRDPGYWKVEELTITAVLDWQQKGYPDGIGYAKPEMHPSLANPKSELEKLAAKLDKKLEKVRSKSQDFANPSNWLVVANDKDIAAIERKWILPEKYLLFLKNYSPLRVGITGERFVECFFLYGALELIERQIGYAYDGISQQPLTDWPLNFVVIGDDGGDPFCIDIAAASNGDAPVYTAMHGQGEWEFEMVSEGFIAFLKILSK